MKSLLLTILTLGSTFLHGSVIYSWDSGFAGGGSVPDGSSTGWSDTRNVSGISGEVVDVNVTLNISGGYNGDLYVYIAHNGQMAVLLNRAGRTSTSAFGYGDAGMNVTFNDQAAQTTDIHLYRTVPSFSISGGTEWRPDARAIDPATVLDSDSRTATLAVFNGASPNGDWTLFAADRSGGAVSTVANWGLEISAVPEPVTGALALFAAASLVRAIITIEARRRKGQGPQ